MEKTAVIESKSGKIQGYKDNGIEIFKNIPFAEPPIGELRFAPPVAKKPWKDVLEATEYGNCAWQGYTQLEEWLGKPEPEDEDCLNLNIWTPATDGKKRPVMFWVHGGAFVIGTGKQDSYDGTFLANRGDVVIVTINYRLGTFGFLYVKGKTVNVGSLDQILALQWVHDNIEKFGGDPNNITIFGESAGAYSVVSLCAMPGAKGLVNRCIAQSAPFIDSKISDKKSKKILRKLGVKGGDLDELRKIAPKKIIEVQNSVFESDPTDIMALRPLITGATYPKHPLKAFQDGECKDIDFMIGTNLEEFKLFAAMDILKEAIKEDAQKLLVGFMAMGAGITPDRTNEIINLYKQAREEAKLSNEPMELFNAIVTDYAFRISTIRLLEGQAPHNSKNFNYLFTWPTPFMDHELGCCHALEIPFVFGSTEVGEMAKLVPGAPKDLSEKMMDAWIAFAHTGNPNHDGLPEWPSYNSETRATMVLGHECKVENALFETERKAWDGILES